MAELAASEKETAPEIAIAAKCAPGRPKPQSATATRATDEATVRVDEIDPLELLDLLGVERDDTNAFERPDSLPPPKRSRKQ